MEMSVILILTTIMLTVTMKVCSNSNYAVKYKFFICSWKPFIYNTNNGDTVEFTFSEIYILKKNEEQFFLRKSYIFFVQKSFQHIVKTRTQLP